jgi:hypothetical protein
MTWLELLFLVPVAVGAFIFLRDILREPGAFFVRCDPRLHRVRRRLYDLLRESHADLFDGSDAMRFTLLMPDAEHPDELRPVLRYGWGRASCDSTARFRRGEGLAGRAWELESPLLVARLPTGQTRAHMRKLHRELFALGEGGAGALSDAMLQAQALLAASVHDTTGAWRGVLCADVLDGRLVPEAGGANSEALEWYRDLLRLAAGVGRLVEPVRDAGRPASPSLHLLAQSSDRSASVSALRLVPTGH